MLYGINSTWIPQLKRAKVDFQVTRVKVFGLASRYTVECTVFINLFKWLLAQVSVAAGDIP